MNNYSHTPLSGRVLFAAATCVIITASVAALLHCWFGYDEVKAVNETPKVGIVTGVVSSDTGSCAVVDTSVVREGDAIGDIAIIGIHDSGVAFSKSGVTWQQEVRDTPNKAWAGAEK